MQPVPPWKKEETIYTEIHYTVIWQEVIRYFGTSVKRAEF